MSTQPHRIGIDARLAGIQHGGIGRYIHNLLIRLPSLAKAEIEWVWLFHDQKQANSILENIPKQQHQHIHVLIEPIAHYSLEEQLHLPAIWYEQKIELLHIPHFNIPVTSKLPFVVTIHDLLWHEYRGAHVTTLPGWKYRLKYSAYRFIVRMAVKRAKTVIVPSHTIKDTIKKYFTGNEKKVVITPEGIEEKFFHLPAPDTEPKKAILYVGSLYPHKNIEVVLRALAELPEYGLWLVGSRDVFQVKVAQQVKEMNLEKRVKFLGKLNDEELAATMTESFCLVQPSLFEGFGLTGLEAMAGRLPVIASDIPVFKEVYGRAALFFAPDSPHQFAQQIRELENRVKRHDMIQRGRAQAKQFSWDTMARQTLDAYEHALAAKK